MAMLPLPGHDKRYAIDNAKIMRELHCGAHCFFGAL